MFFERPLARRKPKLRGSPQRYGIVRRVRISTPRKPNSAKRPVVKTWLSSRRWTLAHIPGQGHNLRRYSKVLVAGVGPRDLPAVNYTCIRGVLDFAPQYSKKKRRSIYGVKKHSELKTHLRRKYRKIFNE